jgi:hypothetical protein
MRSTVCDERGEVFGVKGRTSPTRARFPVEASSDDHHHGDCHLRR